MKPPNAERLAGVKTCAYMGSHGDPPCTRQRVVGHYMCLIHTGFFDQIKQRWAIEDKRAGRGAAFTARCPTCGGAMSRTQDQCRTCEER